jgi:YD repeat-containing protein
MVRCTTGVYMTPPSEPGSDNDFHAMKHRVGIASLAIFLALLGVSWAHAQTANSVQYFYDDLGRLTRVVDQNGNAATYTYDAVGNLLSITRSTVPANNGLAILNFAPQQGPVGQTVTIQGQRFNTTASGDAVQFNGTAAIVTAGTADYFTGNGNGPGGVVTGGRVTLGVGSGAAASALVTKTTVDPFGSC